MNCVITEESLADLNSYWSDSSYDLNWASVFVSPAWMQVWYRVFGAGEELYLRAIRQQDTIIGIAPLKKHENSVSFVGNADVCDYLDFIVAPGKEDIFFNALLDYLKSQGIGEMDLKSVRHDSTVFTHLADAAKKQGYHVICEVEDSSSELALPGTWDEYLELLTTKQCREVKRKLRRLHEAGRVEFRCIDGKNNLHENMNLFLKMFVKSRPDKADFLTEQMRSFFNLLADDMAMAGFLRICILELDTRPIAMTMCFDYNDSVYLYNSGYEPEYYHLSAGLMSKVLGIKDTIQRGKKGFDFLKGAEIYKQHLGGKAIPIYGCRIILN